MIRFRTALIIVMTCVLCGAVAAAPPESYVPPGSAATKDFHNDIYIDANQILMFVANHGSLGMDMANVFGNSYGTYFPYFGVDSIYSGAYTKSPLYAAGLWLGGVVAEETRLAVAEYSTEYVPGPMSGGTWQPDNSAFRVYKLYRDSLADNPNNDYNTWPVSQGAPVDNQGLPDMLGEQMMWTVYNDADPNQHDNGSGETDPLGIEVQQTVWAYSEEGTDTTFINEAVEVFSTEHSEVDVEVFAINPEDMTGDTYQVIVGFNPELGNVWTLYDVTTGMTLLENQTEFTADEMTDLIDGIKIDVSASAGSWDYTGADPPNISPVALDENSWYEGGRWFTGGNHGGDLFFGGVFLEPNFFGGTTMEPLGFKPIEIRFQPMAGYDDMNGDYHYSIGEPYSVTDITQGAFMYESLFGHTYEGFFDVPFTVWDVSDPLSQRQLNVVVRDRDGNHQWELHNEADPPDTDLPNDGDQRFNYVWILDTDYDPSGSYYGDGTEGTIDFFDGDGGDAVHDAMWVLWLNDRGNAIMLAEEGVFSLTPSALYTEPVYDTFTFVTAPPQVYISSVENRTVYIKYKLYNKGGNAIDDFYINLWADPDVGGATDDLVGCDTLQDIFYSFNGDEFDLQYGAMPPAIGFKVLAGPLVPSPGNVADFDGAMISDHKNIGMTGFSKYINGTDPDNYIQSYYYMQGLLGDGSPQSNGTRYAAPGDPITGTGDIDTDPEDCRMMASFGPLTFNPGDSQYVLIKMAVAQGLDRLQSVAKVIQTLNNVYVEDPMDYVVRFAPDPQYVLFMNASEPIMDTIRIGRAGADIGAVDLATVRINESIEPASIEILPSHPDFFGSVLQVVFPAHELLDDYGWVWDVTHQAFTVSGLFGDASPLEYAGHVTVIGHSTGDANGDGAVNVADVVYLVAYLFREGAAPAPGSSDVNNDRNVDVGDAVYLINFIFKDGPAPSQ